MGRKAPDARQRGLDRHDPDWHRRGAYRRVSLELLPQDAGGRMVVHLVYRDPRLSHPSLAVSTVSTRLRPNSLWSRSAATPSLRRENGTEAWETGRERLPADTSARLISNGAAAREHRW